MSKHVNSRLVWQCAESNYAAKICHCAKFTKRLLYFLFHGQRDEKTRIKLLLGIEVMQRSCVEEGEILKMECSCNGFYSIRPFVRGEKGRHCG